MTLKNIIYYPITISRHFFYSKTLLLLFIPSQSCPQDILPENMETKVSKESLVVKWSENSTSNLFWKELAWNFLVWTLSVWSATVWTFPVHNLIQNSLILKGLKWYLWILLQNDNQLYQNKRTCQNWRNTCLRTHSWDRNWYSFSFLGMQ